MTRPKRKASSMAAATAATTKLPPSPPRVVPAFTNLVPPPSPYSSNSKKRRTTKTAASTPPQAPPLIPRQFTHPGLNSEILDGPGALRASLDADEESPLSKLSDEVGSEKEETDSKKFEGTKANGILSGTQKSAKTKKGQASLRQHSPAIAASAGPTQGKPAKHVPLDDERFLDPETDDLPADAEEEVQAVLSRPPPVNSPYLPLPWRGRLGYACLNTYLRYSTPPVFSSRTCRIASILENRHPLKFPDEPPHATKNRPDREQPPDVARGRRYVEALGLANARDVIKMLRWNERYGIRFMRLSSEMFPFASHAEYGYSLAPFASEILAEAGRVAAELGHRLTTHPGQFTQLGSPRKAVIDASMRDLEYHDELLTLLKLPEQQGRDAVLILHLGGVFGDKGATLGRFRENYARLSDSVKRRLVLENDDVSWSVHDLLPLCEELNIPLVLDFHHHNIIFDAENIREGTADIVDLFPRILATWWRKQITPKMHYSEPCPDAITPRQRRKHSPRVSTLPPCPDDMDLMIEAKDKEQAVLELMRNFKLPGFEKAGDLVPHLRGDDNRVVKVPSAAANKKGATRKKETAEEEDGNENDMVEQADSSAANIVVISEEDVGMGGSDGRVYWPPGMEHWLRPMKKVVRGKDKVKDEEGDDKALALVKLRIKRRKQGAAPRVEVEEPEEVKLARGGSSLAKPEKPTIPRKNNIRTGKAPRSKGTMKVAKAVMVKRKSVKNSVPSSSPSIPPEAEGDEAEEKEEEEADEDDDGSDEDDNDRIGIKDNSRTAAKFSLPPARQSGRVSSKGRVSYADW